MEISKEGGTLYFSNKHLVIGLYEEYSQFFNPKHYNWLSFQWLYIYTEYERWLGDIEIVIAILGLGLTIRIHLDTPLGKENYKIFEDDIASFKKKYKKTTSKKEKK